MSDTTTTALREAMAAFANTAPPSPELSEPRGVPLWRRPVLAASLGFAAVLVAGVAVLVLGIGTGDGSQYNAPTSSPLEVSFEEIDPNLFRVRAEKWGVLGLDGESARIVFSHNGVDWEPTDIVGFFGVPVDDAATAERWFLRGSDESTMWTSQDGRMWTEIDIPPSLASVLGPMAADSQTVLASISDPFNETPPTLGRLGENLEWQSITPMGLPADDLFNLVGRGNGIGFVAITTDTASFATWTSNDGTSWIGGPVVVIDEPDARSVNTFVAESADGWIALSNTYGDSGRSGTFVHTSQDGREWIEQPSPPFLGSSTREVLRADGAMIVSTGQAVWLTRDGATWVLVRTFDGPVNVWDATVVDDRIVVFWAPRSIDSTTETTIAIPPTTPDPAGTALQDEILADGTVSRDEFESAVAAMVGCMEARGVEVLDWSVDPDGSYGFTIGGEAADTENFCRYSYLDRITEELAR